MTTNPEVDSSNTLGEVSLAVRDYMFDKLQERLPSVFNKTEDPSQVLVCPSTTIESDFSMRQLRRAKDSKSEGVILPFAAVSRIGIPKSEFPHTNRLYEFYQTDPDDPNIAHRWSMFTVTLDFSIRVYTERFDDSEAIIEKFLFMARKDQIVNYHSKILDIDNSCTVLVGDPEHQNIPGSGEKFKGPGYVYVVSAPLLVTAVIGEKGGDGDEVKLITRIDQDVYAKPKDNVELGVDTPDDRIVIEESTI